MKKIFAIAIGGFFGAILRYIISATIILDTDFPFITLIINLSGCLLLSYFIRKNLSLPTEIKLGISTGFFGAYTTFSTLSKQLFFFLQNHQFFLFFLYLSCSVFFGFLFAKMGLHLARKEIS